MVRNSDILAGSFDGVFASSDNGATWATENSGLLDTNILALIVSGNYAFAGVGGTGVWRRPLSEIVTEIHNEENDIPLRFALEQNYPNPFNPTTVVRYQVPAASDVKLVVFDLLGREVSVLVNERRSAGVHEVTFNGSNLASGTYFYRIQARDFVMTRKFLIVR